MFAEIITIGDELLIGQVVDTNSAWMGQELNKIGIEVLRIVSTLERLPGITWRKVGTTSNHHAPYDQGSS